MSPQHTDPANNHQNFVSGGSTATQFPGLSITVCSDPMCSLLPKPPPLSAFALTLFSSTHAPGVASATMDELSPSEHSPLLLFHVSSHSLSSTKTASTVPMLPTKHLFVATFYGSHTSPEHSHHSRCLPSTSIYFYLPIVDLHNMP